MVPDWAAVLGIKSLADFCSVNRSQFLKKNLFRGIKHLSNADLVPYTVGKGGKKMGINYGLDIQDVPIIETKYTQEDEHEGSLRPKNLKEYIGQEKAKEILPFLLKRLKSVVSH